MPRPHAGHAAVLRRDRHHRAPDRPWRNAGDVVVAQAGAAGGLADGEPRADADRGAALQTDTGGTEGMGGVGGYFPTASISACSSAIWAGAAVGGWDGVDIGRNQN